MKLGGVRRLMVRRVVSWVVSQNPAGEGVPGQRIAALNHIAQNWNDSKQTAKKNQKIKTTKS